MNGVLWVLAGALLGLDVGCALVFLLICAIVIKESVFD